MNFGVQVLWDVTLCCWGWVGVSRTFQRNKVPSCSRIQRSTHQHSVTSQRPAVYSYTCDTSSHILLTMTCTKTDLFQLLNSTNGYWQQLYWVSLCFYFKLCPSPTQYYVRDCAHPPYSTMSEMWQHLKKARGLWRKQPDMELYKKQPQNQWLTS